MNNKITRKGASSVSGYPDSVGGEMDKFKGKAATLIETLRKRNGYNRRELALDAGLSDSYVNRLERRMFEPSMWAVETILDVMGYEIQVVKKDGDYKRNAYKTVLDDLCKIDMLVGKYDATHGDQHFINGIWTVMETIAYRVDEDCGDEFNDMFIVNLNKSEEKR